MPVISAPTVLPFLNHCLKFFERRNSACSQLASKAAGYPTRDDARADVFSYIETFYNPKRRHGTAGDTSPVEFERRHFQRLNCV